MGLVRVLRIGGFVCVENRSGRVAVLPGPGPGESVRVRPGTWVEFHAEGTAAAIRCGEIGPDGLRRRA